MNIPENILNALTDEQKKKPKSHSPRKSSLLLQKKRVISCLRTSWKRFQAAGVWTAEIIVTLPVQWLFKRSPYYCSPV